MFIYVNGILYGLVSNTGPLQNYKILILFLTLTTLSSLINNLGSLDVGLLLKTPSADRAC
jgi:hypothetical protein